MYRNNILYGNTLYTRLIYRYELQTQSYGLNGSLKYRKGKGNPDFSRLPRGQPKLDDSNFLAGKEMAMKNHENNQTAFR